MADHKLKKQKFKNNTLPMYGQISSQIAANRPTTSVTSPYYPIPAPIWEFDPFIYRCNEGSQETSTLILQDVCNRRGWKKYGSDEEQLIGGPSASWNLWWRFIPTPIHPKKSIYSWQFTNHIPKAIGFCNKQYLARYLSTMRSAHGDIYDFIPLTLVLPTDYEKLVESHQNRSRLEFSNHENPAEVAQNLAPTTNCKSNNLSLEQDQDQNGNEIDIDSTQKFRPVWIIKPIGKSQGKGIIVVNSVGGFDFMKDPASNHQQLLSTIIVQEYICRPLLIAGYKFDLRLYVCVPSVSPLAVYIYREGLTRFATEKYNIDDLGNCFSHLTNATLNKTGPDYATDKDTIGKGCKWNLSQLRAYLREIGQSDWYMWQRIVSIIILSLIGESEKWISLPHTRNCFEFLGYDILIDEHLRPWLLEVNLCPGLTADCAVDYEVKTPLLNDLFNLVGLPKTPKRPVTNPTKTARSIYEQLAQAQAKSANNYQTPKYMPTPLSRIHPATVERAMDFIKPANKSKFDVNPILKRRLVDMTAIYTQGSIPPAMKIQQKVYKDQAAALNKQSSTKQDGEKSTKKVLGKDKNKDKSTCSKSSFASYPVKINSGIKKKSPQPQQERTHNGLALRNWTEPLEESGGWVRVFPFDAVSQDMCRARYTPMDKNVLTRHIESQLTNARLLATKFRGKKMSDTQFNTALKKVNKLNAEVWIPPCPAVSDNVAVAVAVAFGEDSSKIKPAPEAGPDSHVPIPAMPDQDNNNRLDLMSTSQSSPLLTESPEADDFDTEPVEDFEFEFTPGYESSQLMPTSEEEAEITDDYSSVVSLSPASVLVVAGQDDVQTDDLDCSEAELNELEKFRTAKSTQDQSILVLQLEEEPKMRDSVPLGVVDKQDGTDAYCSISELVGEFTLLMRVPEVEETEFPSLDPVVSDQDDTDIDIDWSDPELVDVDLVQLEEFGYFGRGMKRLTDENGNDCADLNSFHCPSMPESGTEEGKFTHGDSLAKLAAGDPMVSTVDSSSWPLEKGSEFTESEAALYSCTLETTFRCCMPLLE